MEKQNADGLIEQIENLRNELHSTVKDPDEIEFYSSELLQISKKLDDLILKYMLTKKI